MNQVESVTYRAPVSLLLAGSDSPFDPHLLCAGSAEVELTARTNVASRRTYPFAHALADDQISQFDWEFSHPPHSFNDPGIVGACLACTAACLQRVQSSYEVEMESLAKRVHDWERRVLGDQARAYALVSLTGGLVFYRKEFPTHTTIIQFPFHIPKSWDISFADANNAIRTDANIRRMVFAIQHENEAMFRQEYGAVAKDPQYATSTGCRIISSDEVI